MIRRRRGHATIVARPVGTDRCEDGVSVGCTVCVTPVAVVGLSE
jgi:hypothetical protein